MSANKCRPVEALRAVLVNTTKTFEGILGISILLEKGP